MPSKDKELTRLSQDVASSWVSTEVDYTDSIDDKPTKQELKLMGNAQKIRYWNKREENITKMKMRVWKGKNFIWERVEYNIKKEGK